MATVKAELTVVGQVGNIYELRQPTGNGKQPHIDFSVAVTPRRRNENNEWVDGDTTWHNFKAWGRLAENVEKSIRKGDRVIVQGYISLRKEYTNKETGETVPARNQLTAEFVGLDLTFDSAKSDRVPRGGNSNDSRPAQRPAAAAKAAAKPEPTGTDDLDFGDADDLNFDDISF